MTDELEPFDLGITDLNDVDTARPVPRDGEYPFVITAVSKKANKDQTGNNLVVEFESEQEMTSVEGKTIKPGFKLTKYYPLQNKADKSSDWDFTQGLARLQDGVEGTKQGQRPPFKPGTYQGRRVFLNLKAEPDKATGEINCEVKRIKPNNN